MKPPLLPPLVLALCASLGFVSEPGVPSAAGARAAGEGGRAASSASASPASHPHPHASTHAPRHRSTGPHRAHRAHRTRSPPAVTIPHPARHVTYEERKVLFDRAGIPRSRWHDYIVDHRVPLELGGSNELSNLQIQDRATAKRKDRVENYLAERVRHGQLSLGEAQAMIQHWETVRVPG